MIDKQGLSVPDVMNSLTGHEELAIRAKFDQSDPVELLATGERVTWALRALVFAVNLRELKAQDANDPEGKAYEHAMGMTIEQVGDFFADEADEVFDDEPVTPAGKDDAQPVTAP